jgi:hypothetical protein
MSIDKKILEEIKRYNQITSYIFEQEALPPPPEAIPGDVGAEIGGAEADPAAAAAPAVPAPPTPPAAENVDVANDPDVEEIGIEGEVKSEEGGEEETEEIDITDLIDTQKTMSDKQEEYFNNLFSQLETLQSKLGEMDQLVQKLNAIETKVDNYRPKTPEEKLELRSLDSGPFKQKLSDFFEDKMPEMEKSGKNEYVLTSDDIENYSSSDIEKSFDDGIPTINSDMYNK